MKSFSSSENRPFRQKIFRKIPWFYHVIFLVVGITTALLFQFLFLKRWDYPYFFIFIIGVALIYLVLYLLFCPLIKQNWFWRKP